MKRSSSMGPSFARERFIEVKQGEADRGHRGVLGGRNLRITRSRSNFQKLRRRRWTAVVNRALLGVATAQDLQVGRRRLAPEHPAKGKDQSAVPFLRGSDAALREHARG